MINIWESLIFLKNILLEKSLREDFIQGMEKYQNQRTNYVEFVRKRVKKSMVFVNTFKFYTSR